jgi:nucleoside-diphosphate-sugar epimerase
MATLLVIGGTGFFGKSVLDAFSRGLLDQWQIEKLILIARDTSVLKKSKLNLPNVELFDGDICRINNVPRADFVIHAAASADEKNYLRSPLKQRKNIISGTSNYCEIAKKDHIHAKIVYVSSGAVYGKQPDNLTKIPEDFPFADINQLPIAKRDYAQAKRDSECQIQNLGLNGLKVSIARCFAFVGPWLPLNKHFAIGNFISDGLQGHSPLVNSKALVYRSYMYADDLVRWLLTIADNSSCKCPIYNVGSDESILITDLAKEINSYFNLPFVNYTNLSNEIDRYVPDIFSIQKDLNLKLNYNLKNAIGKTIELLRYNQEQLKNISNFKI